jgi:predicted acylesterase/phospholipase RssA
MSTSTSMAHPAAGRAAYEPRTAFVLAGGAALGAMQAGMIHALYERGIAPDLLIGASAGALNAPFLASRPATVATAHELAAVWRGLRRSDILPLRPATLLSGLAGRRDHLIPDRALRRRPSVLLIPGWLSPSRSAARVTLRSPSSASNATSRLRSTPVRLILPFSRVYR